MKRTVVLASLLGTVALASACFTSSEGLEPPTAAFYFPTGLVVSPGGTTLYVANSDFDLQYNGGTVQAVDVASLRNAVETIAQTVDEGQPVDQACSQLGLADNADELLHPSPCSPLDVQPYIKATATIGAFASGVELVHNVEGPGARLFVPVRGDPSITYFDVADDRDPAALTSVCGNDAFCLDCGAPAAGERCAPEYRIGENPYRNIRNLILPSEPVGIDAAELSGGDALVVAHQTQESVSLLVNRWENGGPTLEYLLSDLPVGPTEVAALPVPRASIGDTGVSYRPGFLVTYRESARLSLLRYEDDARSSPDRPFLTEAGGVTITSNSAGDDSRGVAVDGSERQACEASCGADDLDCLVARTDIPMAFYVGSRAPATLIVGRIDTVPALADGNVVSLVDTLTLTDSVSLSFGVSRVEVGPVVTKDGTLGRRVFATAFDSRFVFGYDPIARRVDTVIRTGRGPHDVAFDFSTNAPFSHMYVGHFTDSYVGVVDLDMRRPTYGQMLLTVGPPVPPRDADS